MISNLQTAHWEHSKKKAELIADKKVLIEIEFTKKIAIVKSGKEKYEISRVGFWCPQIIIKQKDAVIAMQKQVGIWGTKSEFVIDNQTYNSNTREGALFNITYAFDDNEILTYELDASKNKPKIIFEVKSNEVPEQHLTLLLALGFYFIRNVAVEAMANDFIISAVA